MFLFSGTKASPATSGAIGFDNRTRTSAFGVDVPTKNTFINFPTPQSPSEHEYMLKNAPSKSCPTSGILGREDSKHGSVAIKTLPDGAFDESMLETTASANARKSAASNALSKASKALSLVIDGMFMIILELSSDPHRRLGLFVDYSSGTDVRIKSIDEGLIQEWNRVHANRGERLVRPGDYILSINDVRDPVKMLQQCALLPDETQIVEIRIMSGPQDDDENPCNKGSTGHPQGLCRPCAYIHKSGGCQRDAQCTYCHLCPPGELKRRKQVKLFFRKMMYNIQRQHNLTNDSPVSASNPQIEP